MTSGTQWNPSDQNSKLLSLSDFNYELDESLIAQSPLAHRDDARLLVWKNKDIKDDMVKQLKSHIPEGTLFIVNNSRVIASRIRFSLPTGAGAEFLLLEPSSSKEERWSALARPIKKLKVGMKFDLGHGLFAEITFVPAQTEAGPEPIEVKFSKTGTALLDWLYAHGEMPLPPYIERKNVSASVHTNDRERYQTVYSEPSGSVAAPTAGLHFTPELIQDLKDHGVMFSEVTLHVGAGTFLPVKTHNVDQHMMHSERFMIPSQTYEHIKKAKMDGRKVVVVGTTALRSLEGLEKIANETSQSKESLCDKWLRTEIFIRPRTPSDRFAPWAADALMTNFHQPESTLFMLVCSLVGYDHAKRIYAHATEKKYRFFSYGDSSLLWLK